MKLFAGNGCPLLAGKIAQVLGERLSNINLTQFADGEISVEILDHVRGEDAFIIQSTGRPANDNLMELACIADALKRSDAGRIIAVIPLYGYGRQDRRPDFKRTPITSKLCADLIQAAGVKYVVTVDIHSEQQQGFFDVPFVNVSASRALIDHINTHRFGGTAAAVMAPPMIVSPDAGGVKRAMAFGTAIEDEDIAIINKRRPRPNESEVMNIIGDVEDRDCILVDDMADTAGTLVKAAVALKECGANRVWAYVTHPVLSSPAIERIRDSELESVVVTDTIPLREDAQFLESSGRIEVVSIAHLLGQTIQRISSNQSISEMFPLSQRK